MMSTCAPQPPFAVEWKARRSVRRLYPTKTLSGELQKHIHVLGFAPRRTLETFVDLGLTDGEIARYFKMDERHISSLREHWEI